MTEWTIQARCVSGRRNQQLALRCQDAAAFDAADGYLAMALADGSGRTDCAASGAEVAAKVLAKLLSTQGEQLFRAARQNPDFLQHNILMNIRRNQRRLCPGVHAEQMHTTLSGCVIDLRRNRYLYIHLGDGWIGCRKDGEEQWLSRPENGAGFSETVLTSSADAFSHLRMGMGSLDGVEELYLLSDGWREMAYSAQRETFFAGQELPATKDDLGACRMVYTNPEGKNIYE